MMTNGIENNNVISQFKKTIDEMVKEGIKKERITTYITAVISRVNSNGTFDVYFPPDQSSTKTGLINKSHELLKVGDTVEICTKNGSLANSWIAVKHGISKTGTFNLTVPSGVTKTSNCVNIGTYKDGLIVINFGMDCNFSAGNHNLLFSIPSEFAPSNYIYATGYAGTQKSFQIRLGSDGKCHIWSDIVLTTPRGTITYYK